MENNTMKKKEEKERKKDKYKKKKKSFSMFKNLEQCKHDEVFQPYAYVDDGVGCTESMTEVPLACKRLYSKIDT